MTEFEYFSAMIAVILALGVTHILGQLGSLAQSPGSVRLHWVPTVWAAIILVSHFLAWWNIWSLESSLSFSFHAFMYMLIGPTALFLAARLIIPPVRAGVTIDLRDHFHSVHRAFFAIVSVFIAWPAILEIALPGPPSYTGIAGHIVLLVPVIVCAMSADHRVHKVGTVLIAGIFALVVLDGIR